MLKSYSVARFSYRRAKSEINFEDELPLPEESREIISEIFPVLVKRELSMGNLRFSETIRGTVLEILILSIDDDRFRGVMIVDHLPHAAKVKAKPVAEAIEGVKKKVLVVEDNDSARVVVAGMLRKLDLEVDLAENGLEGFEKAGEKNYSLILMDLAMPVMDGFEATNKIKTELAEPYKSVPVLALTASAFNEMKDRVYAAGMDGYVAKPVKLKELLEAIDPFISDRNHKLPVDREKDPFVVNGNIDLTYLREVSRGDLQFAVDILQSFLETNSKLLSNINFSLSIGDLMNCRENCHKLRPTLSYVGLKKVIPLMDKFHNDLLNADPDLKAELILLKKIMELTSSASGDIKEVVSIMLKKIGRNG